MVRTKRDEDEREYISTNLKELRKAKYKTIKEFADEIGIHYQQVAAWERGARSPDLFNIKKLAKHLGVEPHQITDKPDNWDEIKGQDKSAPEATKAAGDNSADNDGSKDFVGIVTMLTNFQSQYNNGELNISKDEYLKRLQRVSEFIAFEYRDVTP